MTQSRPVDQVNGTQMSEHFEKVATTYESNNGDVTNAMCRRLIELCGPSGSFPSPITSTSVIHDNASGPGVLAGEVLRLPGVASGNVSRIHCTDFSPAMIRVLESKGWGQKYGVEALVMDSQALSFPDNTFTHSFTNLGIFALPDPLEGMKEIHRTLQPEGLAIVTTIKDAGWVLPFQRAQKRVRPGDEIWPGLLAPEWSESTHLKELAVKGGFKDGDVQLQSFAVSFSMKDFAQKQGQIISMATKALTKDWLEEEATKFDGVLREEVDREIESDASKIEIWIAVAKK